MDRKLTEKQKECKGKSKKEEREKSGEIEIREERVDDWQSMRGNE